MFATSPTEVGHHSRPQNYLPARCLLPGRYHQSTAWFSALGAMLSWLGLARKAAEKQSGSLVKPSNQPGAAMPHQQRKQGQTRMNINTETWEDGRIVYTFTRAKIDYTVVPQEKGQFDVYKRNNQRGSISLDCYANGVSFQGKKAPKFIIPIFELIAA
jgi:hypothetical protein